MKVLVVDDDVQLGSILGFALRREGWGVVNARDGEAALEVWADENPDLVLLDINLPKLSGLDVLRRIRSESTTPVIMLTVRSDEEDVVRGLDLGADDYIAKPFSPKTLVARIRAVARRGAAAAPEPDLTLDGITLDFNRQELVLNGQEPIRLTPLEFRLLQHLMVNRDRVVEYENLIQHVWGPDASGDRELLKQLVRRLRRKIEADPGSPRYVETVANVGYCFHAA